jgi:hypothetical protein
MRGDRWDSNPQPPGPQPGALPIELRPPRTRQSSPLRRESGHLRRRDRHGGRGTRPAAVSTPAFGEGGPRGKPAVSPVQNHRDHNPGLYQLSYGHRELDSLARTNLASRLRGRSRSTSGPAARRTSAARPAACPTLHHSAEWNDGSGSAGKKNSSFTLIAVIVSPPPGSLRLTHSSRSSSRSGAAFMPLGNTRSSGAGRRTWST